MSKVLIIMWREFRQTVMRKVFLFALLGIPLLLAGVTVVAAIIMVNNKQPPLAGTLVIVDPGGEVTEAARVEFTATAISADQKADFEAMAQSPEQMMQSGSLTNPSLPLARGDVRVEVERGESVDTEALRERVREGDLLALAIVEEEILATDPDDLQTEFGPRQFKLEVSPGMDSDHSRLIERRVGQAIVRVRATRAGIDPETAQVLLRRPNAETVRLGASGEDTDEDEASRVLKELIPGAFMMLLWIATFSAGQHLLMSTIEEKSNRVMEVLLSAVSPLQLMAGKILGQGTVGLLIMLVYSSLGIAALISFAFMHLVAVSTLVYFAIYFFMAYFMVASAMAAVGSAVSDIREANTLMTPLMLVLMIPLMLWMPISNSPNGAIAYVFSFLPPAIPFAMILRIAADEPVPTWQILTTIVWGFICVLGMVWMAAKIFRIGVLMYGKPPSPLELFRWLRRA